MREAIEFYRSAIVIDNGVAKLRRYGETVSSTELFDEKGWKQYHSVEELTEDALGRLQERFPEKEIILSTTGMWLIDVPDRIYLDCL